MKRLAAVLALALLLGFGGARLLAGDGSTETVVATGCDPAEAIPSSGMLSLAYTAPSAPPHLDHDDYVLGGRIRWDSQAALDCIGADVDAAYEHEIAFDGDFTGRIWRLEHTFPESAQVYADELVNDQDGRTVLTLGVFRPEHLTAGVDYWFTLDTPLLAQPDASEHRFTLDGEVGSRICSAPNAWCVERSNAEVRRGLIGDGRGFDVALGGCWSWEYDTVSPCSGLSIPAIDDLADGDLDVSVDGGEIADVPAPPDPTADADARPSQGDAPANDADSERADDGTSSSGDGSDAPTPPAGPSAPGAVGDATTTTVASQAPPGVTTTSMPSGAGGDPANDPGSVSSTTTPPRPSPTSAPTTPTTVPGAPTTTPVPTTRPSPTTTSPATPPAPTTSPPTTRPPTTTTRPPTTTTPPTTRPPATTTPPTAPPTTSPPPAAPSFSSISATSSRAGRVRVVARINWPAGATEPTCVTTLDAAVVSIKDCGARLTLNLRGVATGTHTVRVRACDRSIACTDSPAVAVTVG